MKIGTIFHRDQPKIRWLNRKRCNRPLWNAFRIGRRPMPSFILPPSPKRRPHHHCVITQRMPNNALSSSSFARYYHDRRAYTTQRTKGLSVIQYYSVYAAVTRTLTHVATRNPWQRGERNNYYYYHRYCLRVTLRGVGGGWRRKSDRGAMMCCVCTGRERVRPLVVVVGRSARRARRTTTYRAAADRERAEPTESERARAHDTKRLLLRRPGSTNPRRPRARARSAVLGNRATNYGRRRGTRAHFSRGFVDLGRRRTRRNAPARDARAARVRTGEI